jgi:hypothetical protein
MLSVRYYHIVLYGITFFSIVQILTDFATSYVDYDVTK